MTTIDLNTYQPAAAMLKKLYDEHHELKNKENSFPLWPADMDMLIEIIDAAVARAFVAGQIVGIHNATHEHEQMEYVDGRFKVRSAPARLQFGDDNYTWWKK